MTEPAWLLKPTILAVHDLMIARFGGAHGLRDEGLLDSALGRPVNLHQYKDCKDIPPLAASCAAGIIQNHLFIDGNKRAGFIAAYIFLERNGLTLTVDEITATAMTLSLAASEIDEATFALWLDQNCVVERNAQ